MTVITDGLDVTGPGVGQSIRQETERRWPAPSLSENKVALGREFLLRAQKTRSQIGPASAGRTALLGLLLAALEDVPFEDTALLLGVKPRRLEKLMHGEEQVPEHFEGRWVEIVEILRHLHSVLRPAATGRWLRTSIPDLAGATPLSALQRGRSGDVLAVVRSYRHEAFA